MNNVSIIVIIIIKWVLTLVITMNNVIFNMIICVCPEAKLRYSKISLVFNTFIKVKSHFCVEFYNSHG